MRAFAACLLLVVAGALSACQDAAQPPPEKVDFTDLASRLTTPAVPVPSDQKAYAAVRLVCFDAPLDADLDGAWAIASQKTISGGVAELWRANGLRVGVVEADKLRGFLGALPQSMTVQRRRLVTNAQEHALPFVPAFAAPVVLRLTLAPERPSEKRFAGGRFQFLARFEPLTPASAGLTLDLVPHCNQPQMTLTPRPADQVQRDGPRFDELALHVQLAMGQWLVIGVQAAKPPALPQLSPLPDGGPAASQPSIPPTPTIDFAQLGPALLTARRMGRPVQMLVLLTAEPPAPPVGTLPAP